MKVKVFNGFVQDAFPAKHQSMAQMNEWRDRLRSAVPVLEFDQPYDTCWAGGMVKTVEMLTDQRVWSADYPNSPKDRYPDDNAAVRSQIVLCQRFEWVKKAAETDSSVDIWAWIEPTIFKQRGVTAAVIQQFFRDIEEHPVDAISLPGVLAKQPIVDPINHWRFCGSCWVCPRKYAEVVCNAMKGMITFRTQMTHRLCWDNSSWSYMELLNVLPMRWYAGNHDETQFTGYKQGVEVWPNL